MNHCNLNTFSYNLDLQKIFPTLTLHISFHVTKFSNNSHRSICEILCNVYDQSMHQIIWKLSYKRAFSIFYTRKVPYRVFLQSFTFQQFRKLKASLGSLMLLILVVSFEIFQYSTAQRDWILHLKSFSFEWKFSFRFLHYRAWVNGWSEWETYLRTLEDNFLDSAPLSSGK